MSDQTIVGAAIFLLFSFGSFMAFFQTQLKSYAQENTRQNEKLETELRHDITEQAKELDTVRTELAKERQQREQLEREVRELQLQLARLEGKNEILNSTNLNLKSELKDAQSRIAVLEHDHRLKADQITSLQAQLKAKQEALLASEIRVRDLESVISTQVDGAAVEVTTGL